MACPLRRRRDLGNETLRPARPAASIANAAGPDPEVVVAAPHRLFSLALRRATALGPLKSLVLVERAPARRSERVLETPIPPTTCARPRSALLSCRLWIGGSRRPHPSGTGADLAEWAPLATCRFIAMPLHSLGRRTGRQVEAAMQTGQPWTVRPGHGPTAQAATTQPTSHADYAP
jgi:hypothetical protein